MPQYSQLITIIFLLAHFLTTSNCSRILFLNMFNSKSHALTMMPLAERLFDDGHDVSMYTISANRLKIPSKKVKILESLVKGSSTDDAAPDTGGVSRIFWSYEMTPYVGAWCYEIGLYYLEEGRDEQLDEVLATPYDLAVVDETYTSLQGSIALKLKEDHSTKIITFATTELMPVASNMRGYARNPVTVPNTFLLSSEVYEGNRFAFLTRTRRIFEYFIDQIYSGPVASLYSEASGKLLGLTSATKSKTFQNSILTVNDFPDTFSFVQPRGNDLIRVGEHCYSSANLPSEFRDFVEDSMSKGTIYVAMGSYLNLEDGPKGTVEAFIEALNYFKDYRVIWSHKGNVTGAKCHVKSVNWAPQKELLAHEKTVAFITHGGLKSAKEGVCSGVPMLFLPFYGDQPRNAHRFVTNGIAEALYKKAITSLDIQQKLEKLLVDPSYKNNVMKVLSYYLDAPISSLDLGAFHISQVLRRTESQYSKFKRRSIFMNHLQYLNLDIFLVILVILFIVSKF
ncbi:UDP-glucuronosyltransferase [Caenorhabditis elegans]|uniref:UDP-glucuronosyltransferase n=2 Tax=Caenorhabditis elegans TaxID=6239 RepID=Q19222_CAEEL|nr:UDP-glucuronosyltransferase [Caenorhabditis elegans]CAA94585.3 UDP-glucuronosyltransferase [Caenorhabditis elegans]|eukprot:NP_502373.3 UDP-glucuronosyltransferase [Caenorhabditis elegans]